MSKMEYLPGRFDDCNLYKGFGERYSPMQERLQVMVVSLNPFYIANHMEVNKNNAYLLAKYYVPQRQHDFFISKISVFTLVVLETHQFLPKIWFHWFL